MSNHKYISGDNLDNQTPFNYTKKLMPEPSKNIALFPHAILDNLNSSSYWKGGKDVGVYYISHPVSIF